MTRFFYPLFPFLRTFKIFSSRLLTDQPYYSSNAPDSLLFLMMFVFLVVGFMRCMTVLVYFSVSLIIIAATGIGVSFGIGRLFVQVKMMSSDSYSMATIIESTSIESMSGDHSRMSPTKLYGQHLDSCCPESLSTSLRETMCPNLGQVKGFHISTVPAYLD